MTQVLQLPVWVGLVWTFAYALLAAAIGYGSAVLSKPSRRTTAIRLLLEFAVAFVVAFGLVLGTAAAFTLLSLLV